MSSLLSGLPASKRVLVFSGPVPNGGPGSNDRAVRCLAPEVAREKLLDAPSMLEAKRLRVFHFTVEDEADGSWQTKMLGPISGEITF